jgi:hypothetical protein
MALFVVLFAEIESLRRRVKDKEKEVEEVRRTSLAPYKVLWYDISLWLRILSEAICIRRFGGCS